jgi:DNA-binding XRE family transcriptional regulator
MSELIPFEQVMKQLNSDPDFVTAYEELQDEFDLLKTILRMRTAAGLTQEHLAKQLGTQKSSISRLESGRSNPSWQTLQRYAEACGYRLRLEIEKR